MQGGNNMTYIFDYSIILRKERSSLIDSLKIKITKVYLYWYAVNSVMITVLN